MVLYRDDEVDLKDSVSAILCGYVRHGEAWSLYSNEKKYIEYCWYPHYKIKYGKQIEWPKYEKYMNITHSDVSYLKIKNWQKIRLYLMSLT